MTMIAAHIRRIGRPHTATIIVADVMRRSVFRESILVDKSAGRGQITAPRVQTNQSGRACLRMCGIFVGFPEVTYG
jgi:hypothetical protein